MTAHEQQHHRSLIDTHAYLAVHPHNNICLLQVYAWGGNSVGQLGLGDTHNRRAPSIVEGLWAMPVQQLAAGDEHSAALTASGFLFTWGCNEKGHLGLPARAEQAVQVSMQRR